MVGWPFPLGFGLDGRLLLARRGRVYVKFIIISQERGENGILARNALPIEQSTPGFANSRVCALPHVHPRGLGSRPSSLRGRNEEFYKKS